MKKIILILCVLSFAFGFPVNATFNEHHSNIKVLVLKGHVNPRPRTETKAPECIYDEWSRSIMVGFTEDTGGFTVTVFNHTTGEQWFETGQSEEAVIYLSDSEGLYTIWVETESGSSYSGDFVL